jgi:hypothetical protein
MMMKQILPGLALIFSGVGIGWFIGMSVSPVVHILVASILTLAAGIVSALAGVQNAVHESADPASKAEKPSARSDIASHYPALHRTVSPFPLEA